MRLILAFVFMLLGCEQHGGRMLVVVHSDRPQFLEVRADASLDGTSREDFEIFAGDGGLLDLPFSFVIDPSDPSAIIDLVVVGTPCAGCMPIRRHERARVTRNETRVWPIYLYSGCQGQTCDDRSTCGLEGCEPIPDRTAVLELAPERGRELEVGIDVQRVDAPGPIDAGTDTLDLDAPLDAPVDTPLPDVPGCVVGPEVCNGRNDDCDGATDEGMLCAGSGIVGAVCNGEAGCGCRSGEMNCMGTCFVPGMSCTPTEQCRDMAAATMVCDTTGPICIAPLARGVCTGCVGDLCACTAAGTCEAAFVRACVDACGLGTCFNLPDDTMPDRLYFDTLIGALDDDVSSIELVNVRSVTLWANPSRGGRAVTFTDSCPDLHAPRMMCGAAAGCAALGGSGFGDMVGSLEITP